MPGSLLPRSRESMHADETAQFRSPYQPNAGDDVPLRLRIGREDTPDVRLIMDGREDVPMKRVGEDSHFAYYEAQTGRFTDCDQVVAIFIDKGYEFCTLHKDGQPGCFLTAAVYEI